MGGTVSLTLRTPDGTVHRMTRWTNILPWAVCNRRFYEKDPAHIEAILAPWVQMRLDYDQNAATGNFRFQMTDGYGRPGTLAPRDYGLVVLDMMKDRILTMQNYTSFDDITPTHVYAGGPEDTVRVRELYDAGRMTEIETEDANILAIPETWDKLTALMEDRDYRKTVYGLPINTKPFTVQKIRSLADMKSQILRLGFVLTPEDEAQWEKFSTER